MESDEELPSFSDAETPSSPPKRTLKRLRKAKTDFVSTLDSTEDLHLQGFHEHHAISEPEAEATFVEENQVHGGEDDDDEEEEEEEIVEQLEKENSDLDGFEVKSTENESNGDGDKEEDEGEEVNLVGEDTVMDEIEKEKIDVDFDEVKESNKEEKMKKRKLKSNSNSDGFDQIPVVYASSKKERRNRLKELHAESQKLLRETRDASFKPAPIVHKPVSSVLEKIRKRKQEITRKFVIPKSSDYIEENGCSSREIELDSDVEEFSLEHKKDIEVSKSDIGALHGPVELDCGLGNPITEGSKDVVDQSQKTKSPERAPSEELKEKFRAPVDDTQELMIDSQTSDSIDELPVQSPSSPLEEVLAPSVLAMNLRLDSALGDDSLPDEEDNDKENVDPRLDGSDHFSLSPKGDPVKAFVEEEAEEEDDSDNDLERFQDEEDDDVEDTEEVNDIIATEYEEKPVDKEMRDQLHQKWLEQQDAAGTENLLQKLKCGSSKQRETALLEEQDDSDNEEDEEYASDGGEDCSITKNLVKMNLKKAKEMIPLMFTDKDDVYISSDDEETGKKPALRNLSDKTEGEVSLMSLKNDESSREIFSLIKKLNTVPDNKKKVKAPPRYHMLSSVGNANTSSKSSFLGRGSKNSLPSLQKHGSTKARSFVFERGDSSSRGMEAMAEAASDMPHREDQPRKSVTTVKLSNSQARSSTQTAKTESETKTGPSLHEILRSSSVQSSNIGRKSMVSEIEAIYAAFKMDLNQPRKQTSVSMRSI